MMGNVYSKQLMRGRFWYIRSKDPEVEDHRIQDGDIIEINWMGSHVDRHLVRMKTTYMNWLWDHNFSDGPPLAIPPVHTPYIIVRYGDTNLEMNLEDAGWVKLIHSDNKPLERFDMAEVPFTKVKVDWDHGKTNG